MKTKLLITSIIALSSYAYAHDHSRDFVGINSSASGKPVGEIGFDTMPVIPEGVTILPKAQNFHFKLPPELQKSEDNKKRLGYFQKRSDEAIELLSMRKSIFIAPEAEKYYYSNEVEDTHLKKNLSQIKLAFDYKPLSFVSPQESVGFGAYMGYENGWIGIVEMFKYKDMGICKYFKNNARLNHSAIQLSKEDIRFYINEKPAFDVISGRQKDGFAYTVTWYSNDYFQTIICASEKLDLKLIDEVKKLALLIDND